MDNDGSLCKVDSTATKIKSDGGTTSQILNEKRKKSLKLKELMVVVKKLDTDIMSKKNDSNNKKSKGNKNNNSSDNKNIKTLESDKEKIQKKSKIKKDLVSIKTVSEPSSTKSHDTSAKFLSTIRKRFSSRIYKRGNVNNRKNRPVLKKLTKIKNISGGSNNKNILNDDNSTSNSENSEHTNLFNDINWEENLEIDASDALVDEFAPRPKIERTNKIMKIKKQTTMDLKCKEKLKTISENKLEDIKEELNIEKKDPVAVQKNEEVTSSASTTLNDSAEQLFSAGLQIHVQDYKTAEWNKASILEVDWEEEEVLVHYDTRKPDEWVSMSSQRLSRSSKHPTATAVLSPKVPIKVEEMKPETKQTVSSSPKIEIKSEIKETSTSSTINSESTIRLRRNQNPSKLRRYRTSNRKNWRFKRQTSLESTKKYEGKFQIGEKVLAKWSNHRMQKFPAVIKNISGKGSYDLLFYDGFEKTINEEHIFKTTEEEAAKYQDSKPSEADSFVDMDADSKEARRQRKRKTFDDYVFAKDIKRIKRNKNVDEVNKKSPLLPTLHTHCRKGRKRKKLLSEGKEENDSNIQNPLPDSTSGDQENFNMAGTDCDNYHELLGESEDRWTGDVPPDAKPLNIECSDGIRKSVIVPDKVLPHGWTKHCINRTGQMWETFLISPEGYRLNTTKDLKEYSRQILGSRTPRNLDFLVNTKTLSDLNEKQEHLQPVNNWLPWIGKSSKKKLITGTSVPNLLAACQTTPGTNKIGRVRTLLPKCRTSQVVSTAEPPAATFSEIWRCPKQGCDKKFRKENLLQMHIKHYHVEFTALVGSAPNVVDLATARSEGVNAEHIKSPLSLPTKKLLTKMPSHTPPHVSESIKTPEVESSNVSIALTSPQSVPSIKVEPQESPTPIKPAIEERKSTIKTMLPLRQPTIQETVVTARTSTIESDDMESDDGQPTEPKLIKPGRGRKKSEKKLSLSNRTDDITYPASPTNKFNRKKLPVLEKLHVTTDSNDSYTEEEKTSPNAEATTDEGGVVIERLKSEEIINCICEYREEDGLMIQCDICMCWQHGSCSGVETDSDVPDRYVCYICRHPGKVRSSKKYSYALHYVSQGKLPSFSFREKNEKDIKQREDVLKRCYELSASLRRIQSVERSLKAKINIAEQAGHPKLYLWAKNWDESSQTNAKVEEELDEDCASGGENGNSDLNRTEVDKAKENKMSGIPEPEAPIDLEDCRIKLLDHIDNYYQQLDDRLMSLQTQIAALESEDADLSSNAVSDKILKQTLQILLKDLKTVQKIAAVSS